MPVTNSEQQTTAGSQQVVASATGNVLSQKRFPANFTLLTESETGSVDGLANSFLPANVGHNDRASEILVNGLRDSAANAAQESAKPRLRSDIPTADFITTSSFKTGSKMLIKIEPSNRDQSFNDYKGVLTFDKFSLQNVAEVDSERYQLQETFEDFVLFSFGRQPRVWTFQGVVMNGPNDRDTSFADELIQNYEEYYRATKTTEQESVAYITYEDIIIEGTIVNLTVVRNAQNPALVNVTITVVIHSRNIVGQVLRDGVQNLNIADLLVTTGQVDPVTGQLVSVVERVQPPAIEKAPPNSNDLRSSVAEAQGDLQQLQQESADLNAQRAAAAAAVEENGQREAQALADEQQATQDRAAAEAEVVDPENPTPDEQAAIDEAAAAETQAQAAQTQARASGQAAAVAQEELEEEIAAVDAEQQDLIAKSETLVATAASSSDSPFAGDEVLCATRVATGEAIFVADLLSGSSGNLSSEQIAGLSVESEIVAQGSGFCTVSFTAFGPEGEILQSRTATYAL